MDLHKQLARDVRSKSDRDDAIQFLRALYKGAVKGTSWEEVGEELNASRGSSYDPAVELYEVEGRGVAVAWPEEGMGEAWVWGRGAWRDAPGLVNKSWLEGQRLSPREFLRDFPDANFVLLQTLVKGALDLACDDNRPLFSTAPSSASDPIDEFNRALVRAVGVLAEERANTIAREMRSQLRQAPPSGLFEQDEHVSLWDEYSLQVQHGPPVLEPAWDATIDPLVSSALAHLTPAEKSVLTLWCKWRDDDFSNPLDYDAHDPAALHRLIRNALHCLADEEEQNWVTG